VNVRFTLLAQREFDEVLDYYAALSKATARKLAREMAGGFTRVCQFPESCPFYSPPFRRMKAKSFPYGFFYTVDSEDIVVHAVVHLRRHPAAIRARLRLS
jgi:plasmid stabilization system protein ParE